MVDATVAVSGITAASTLVAGYGSVGLGAWIQGSRRRRSERYRLIVEVDTAVAMAIAALAQAAELTRLDNSVAQRLSSMLGITRPVDWQTAIYRLMPHEETLVRAIVEAGRLGDDDLCEAISNVYQCYRALQDVWTTHMARFPRRAAGFNPIASQEHRDLLSALDQLRPELERRRHAETGSWPIDLRNRGHN